MNFDALYREPIPGVHSSEGTNVSSNREHYKPGSITYEANQAEPEIDPEEKKEKSNESKEILEYHEEDESGDLFLLTKHPGFPLFLALYFRHFDMQVEEIKRLIRDQRGITDNFAYPKFSMSYLLYQAKRLDSYLETLYYFADYPGQKFSGLF